MEPSKLRGSFLLISTIIAAVNTVIANERLPSGELAVTSSDHLEDLYVRVKHRFPKSYIESADLRGPLRGEDYVGMYLGTEAYGMALDMRHPFERPNPDAAEKRADLADKNRICARVFGSPLFKMFDEEVVNFDAETMEPADLQHVDIYANETWFNAYRPLDVEIRGWNAWKQSVDLEVSRQETYREYLFRCVTRKRDSYQTYFISPIYRSWYPENWTMVGRFVFTSDLKVFAVAEEPAVIDNEVIGKTLRAYFDLYESRNQSKTAHLEENLEEDKKSNVLCRLSVPDRIRFCAIVLGNADFAERITFQPLEINVETACEEKRIFASVTGVERTPEIPWFITGIKIEPVKEDIDITYREWTIGCKATRANPDADEQPSLLTYYISRGVDTYTAIVYEPIGEDGYSPYLGLDCVHLVQGRGRVKDISVTFKNTKSNTKAEGPSSPTKTEEFAAISDPSILTQEAESVNIGKYHPG